MVKDYDNPNNNGKILPNIESEINLMDRQIIIASANSGNGSQIDIMGQKSTYIRLDLEALKCFEVVDRQFLDWGVKFANAIALHPSNPAFPAYSGITVLMGAPKSGWLEVSFTKPVSFVSAFVTSSRRTVLSVYDRQDKPIAHAEIPGPNLAGSNSPIPPNAELKVNANNIYRATFYSFDGQITLDNFIFGG